MLKPIVTDTYDFPTLIRRGYVYVDKTAKAALHQIATNNYAAPYTADRKVNEWVMAHPGCKRAELIEAVSKSARTVDRALAALVAAEVIEFRGAPKTGGYYALVTDRV